MCAETKKDISLNLLLPDSNKRVQMLFFPRNIQGILVSLIEAVFILFLFIFCFTSESLYTKS